MNIRKKTAFSAAFLIFAFSASLWAADPNDRYGNIAEYLNDIYGEDENAGLTSFPVLNVPMGGRAEGLGAFAAIADDASFLEFNPAGSSMLPKSEFAFFHNNWVADTKLEGVVWAARFKDLGLAAGAKWLYTPFTQYDLAGERVSSGYYSEGVAILNASYNFLSGYYFAGLSLGVNLKGAFRIMPDFSDSDGAVIGGSGMEQSAVMAMADVGLLTRFDFLKAYSSREKNTSVALVVKNLGPPSMEEALPTVANAAIAYKPIRPLVLGFDFYQPLNMMDISLSEKPYFAFGAAVNITNFLSMRAGAQLKSGSGSVTVGSAIMLNGLALDVNYTMDLLTELQPMNRISLGFRLDLGDNGREVLSEKVDELYLLGLDAYANGKVDEARRCWEEALRLDPKFDPAKESLHMLESREELHRQIESLFRLDF